MKSPKSFGIRRKPKLFCIRQVSGKSMAPRLPAGKVLLAIRARGKLRPGEVVIIRHDGKDKVKRIERIADNQLFVVGDNLNSSSDSRHFGWLDSSAVIGRVIWPRISNA